MKSKLIPIILIVLVLIVAIILAIVFMPKTDKVNKLLEDEANQINILTEIYNDFLNRTNLENDENIVLGASSQKNLLTKEQFLEENLMKLKNIEKVKEDASETFTLYTKYTDKNHIVSLELIRDDELERISQKYEIYVENGTLKFKSDNLGHHLIT